MQDLRFENTSLTLSNSLSYLPVALGSPQADAVQDHFRNQPSLTMVNVKQATYSCVDARADEPMLGTPGGDLAEAMNAAMALMKIT